MAIHIHLPTRKTKDSDYEAGYEKGVKGYRAKVWKNGRVVWLSSASWLTPEEATEAAKKGIEAHSQGKAIGFAKGSADAVNRGESDLRDAVEALASALRDDNEKADLKTLTSAYKSAKGVRDYLPQSMGC